MEAKARLWNVYMSPKHSRELALNIKGMSIIKARKFLKDVSEMKQLVVLKRFNKEVPHHKGGPARYPVKVSKHFSKLLENAVSNALYKGGDEENLKITTIEVYRGHPKKTMGAKSIGKAKQRGRRASILMILTQDDKTVKIVKKVEKKKEQKASEVKKTTTKKETQKKEVKATKKKEVKKKTVVKTKKDETLKKTKTKEVKKK